MEKKNQIILNKKIINSFIIYIKYLFLFNKYEFLFLFFI